MTKFYCLKCKKETETVGEVQDMTNNGRYRLHGNCGTCGKHKNVFTGEGWVIKRKSRKEKADAKDKKETAKKNQQAKKLGLQILESDDTCQECIYKCLRAKK